MNIEYRKILPAESKLYREIRLQSLKTNPERFFTKHEEERNKNILFFEKKIQENLNNQFVIGAFLNNVLVGICSFFQFTNEPEKGELIQLFVQPKYRKDNRGYQLVKETVKVAFELKDITAVTLDVLDIENDHLKDFYLKTGFKVYNEKTEIINEQSFNFIQMSIKKQYPSTPKQ